MLSVIIPARNEIYLEKTIRNVLENAEGSIEVIVELDGYIPDPQIVIDDIRVTFYHHEKSIGQRACINHGVSVAKGKYIMKLDAHCAVDKGFDVKLAEDCQPEWTVVPRMYNLDIETWQPKRHKVTDYMYIGLRENGELRAEYYTGEEYARQHARTEMIDDTMCCMGPGWFMYRDRFLEQGGCDENHGSWGQQGIEVSCKAWLSGGALKVNKKTWFAHWFRGGSGPGFPYPLSQSAVDHARKYSKDIWLSNKWPNQTRKFEWMLERFSPPGWSGMPFSEEALKSLFSPMYWRIIKEANLIKWRSHPVLKFPSDLMLYQRAIYDNKPDFIIETGTKYGGSAVFFGDICELNNHGRVISVDVNAKATPDHPRVSYVTGSSTDPKVIHELKKIVGNGSVMLILDSDHSRIHVKWELHRLSPLVTKGQFLVIEDCRDKHFKPWGPMEARDWFLKRTKRFQLTNYHERFLVGVTMEGWLKKI